MDGLTVVCVCVCVCVCGWLVRVTCLQGGAVYITGSGSSGTFTNCNFTSNNAKYVSLEKEHVDGCEKSKCMTLRLCRSHIARLTICALQMLTLFYTVRLSLVEQ